MKKVGYVAHSTKQLYKKVDARKDKVQKSYSIPTVSHTHICSLAPPFRTRANINSVTTVLSQLLNPRPRKAPCNSRPVPNHVTPKTHSIIYQALLSFGQLKHIALKLHEHIHAAAAASMFCACIQCAPPTLVAVPQSSALDKAKQPILLLPEHGTLWNGLCASQLKAI